MPLLPCAVWTLVDNGNNFGRIALLDSQFHQQICRTPFRFAALAPCCRIMLMASDTPFITNMTSNMKTSVKPFTYDDYLALPDDGKRYEVIDGELSITPAPVPRHQEILLTLSARLLLFVDNNSLGRIYISPIDLALSLVVVVQPDILL